MGERKTSKNASRKARIRALTERSVASGARTKNTILDSAEQLFAAQGFDGTSMRQVGEKAKVPLALVSYHFKSKLGLYRSVFRRRLEASANIRLADPKEIANGTDQFETLRNIARVMVEPIVHLATTPGGRNIARLIARETNDPRESERGIIEENFDPLARAIISNLKNEFPEVDRQSIYWSYLFASGALAINHAATGRIERLSGGTCRSSNAPAILEHLVDFIAGGMFAAFTAHSCRATRKSRRTRDSAAG